MSFIGTDLQENEEAELQAILLQKIIRGRSVQNMMYEGKEKRIELLQEVRSTHALQHAEQQMKRQEKQQVLTIQRQQRLHQEKVNDSFRNSWFGKYTYIVYSTISIGQLTIQCRVFRHFCKGF